MKDIENTEELLNSYIDNELDERRSNEVKRLIDNDTEVRRLFETINRHKSLVGSLRSVTAPEGFSESVAHNLEREMLLADTGFYQHKKGKRRLVFRHFLTTAAMFALLAALSYVVMDVFVPQSTQQKFADNILRRKPKPQIIAADTPAIAKPAEDKPVEMPKGPAVPLVVRLTLVTENPIELDWLIGKALMNTSLFEKTSSVERKADYVRYSLSCDRKLLAGLFGELTAAWPKCSDAIMEVGTEQPGKFVTVNNISARQTLDICKADNYNLRMRVANDLAVINKTSDTDILKNYFARQNSGSELLTVDKPVLTSSEKTDEQPQAEISTDPANLTIIVQGK
ncbi:MAG: hypothetical protein LLF92_08920 [Planctomycetaceae bacterium]|nr:hypothetical protein [Planctomycetaceae bacterium]